MYTEKSRHAFVRKVLSSNASIVEKVMLIYEEVFTDMVSDENSPGFAYFKKAMRELVSDLQEEEKKNVH